MQAESHSLKDLFLAALAVAPVDRPAWLEHASGADAELRRRVERMLAAHDAPHSLLDGAAPTCANAEVQPPAVDAPGTMVGPYKLLEQIGEGGFGVVFMAEQTEPVRRKVALKILKPGMDTRQVVTRFEAERQALALMEHPNIAQVFDGGATAGGRPYFVMELVRGMPITEYCDQNHLTARQRLELFVPVCQAVQHAHQKGIIHRDLKPSNILVVMHDTTPVPKVIDFGIAKALGPAAGTLTDKTLFTGFAQMLGTPLYMSPEQAGQSGLDIDTRSDIYSLGVLLYELLTGTTPFSKERFKTAAYDEIRRIIREEEHPKPSTRLSELSNTRDTQAGTDPTSKSLPSILASVSALRQTEPAKLTRLVRGELDWIVMKCLEKDRNRRYETAAGLARDLQCYLADEPVQACPPSAAYRLRKFARRNKGAVLAVTAVLLALLGGTAGATVGLVRARQAEADAKAQATAADEARADEAAQRLLATEEAAIARAVNDFLQNDLLRQADSVRQADRKFEPDRDVKVRTLLDRAAAEVGKRFADQPRVEAAVREAIGEAYHGLGAYDQAITHLTRARDLRAQAFGPEHPDTLTSVSELARAYRAAGCTAEAIRLYEQVRDGRAATLGLGHPSTLVTLGHLAQAYGADGRIAEAIRLFEQVREPLAAALGPCHPDTLAVLNNLAGAYQAAGRTADAIGLFEAVREQLTATLGPSHPGTVIVLCNLAGAYQAAGRTADAIGLFEHVRDQQTVAPGPGHPDTLATLRDLAGAYRAAGRTAEAIRLFEQVRDGQTATLGPGHPDTLVTLDYLARAYRAVGRTAEAIRLFEQVRDRQTATLGPGHPNTLVTLSDLALAYQDAKRTAEAIRLFEQVRQQQAATVGPDHSNTLVTMHNLASAYRAASRTADAVRLFEQVRERMTATLGPDHPSTLAAMNSLGTAYWSARQLDNSVPLLEETLRGRRAKLGEDHPDTVVTAFNLAVNYRDAGRLGEAVALFDDWLARSRAKLGPDHEHTLYGLTELVEALVRTKQFARAAAACRELLDARSRKLPADHPTRINLLVRLGALLLQAGQPAEAERALRECLAHLEKTRPDGWGTFHTRSLLGGALLAQKKPAEAEPLLLQGYEGLKKREATVPAAGKACLVEALERLVKLYDGWNKKDKAMEWRQKLDEQKKQ